MKIVFLEDVINFGGARKSTINLARHLADRYEVRIVDVHGSCTHFVDACVREGVRLDILIKRDRQIIINYSHSPIKKFIKLIEFVFVTIKARKKLHSLLRSENVDYYVVNNTKVLPLLLANKMGGKVILFARGWFLPQQINRRDRFLYRKLIDKFMCVSEATRYALISSGLARLDNSFTVHNSIDCFSYNSVVPASIEKEKDDKVILVSGGFLPTKGLHVAVDIAYNLFASGFPFKMVITGIVYESAASKKYYEHIVETIKEKRLADKVLLVVDHPQVKEYFKAADIFIHPSDTEGLPRVVMEAMVNHVPVIANAVGGVTDYVLNGFTGVLTRHNNVSDYVAAIQRIETDELFRSSIVANAYNLVSGCYRPEDQIAQFEAAIEG